PGGNVCQAGVTACSGGMQICVMPTNVPDGTACGPNQTCLSGACVMCVAGATCSPSPGNPCVTGVTSCATGMPTCTQTGQAPNGTACGANQVCNAGTCVACTAGLACTPGGNVCQVGTTSCSSGTPTCVASGNAPNGTACGAGKTCNNGVCM